MATGSGCDDGLIQALMCEHRNLERVLDAFEVFLLRIRLGGKPFDVTCFASVLSAYCTRWHQPREERVVLAAAQVLAPGEVSVPQLVAEHRAIAGLLLVLERLGSRGRVWSRDDDAVLQRAGRNLVGLMGYHTGNEEHQLFPLLARHLTTSGLDELAMRTALPHEGEIEPTGEIRALADEIVERYSSTTGSTRERKD
jgi:hemerythrin-like domain-containing protein